MRTLPAALCAVTLCSCAHTQTVQRAPELFPLLAPETLGTSQSVQQVLNVAYADKEATLTAVLTATPQHVQVIGLNAVGVRLFTVDYDGVSVKSERLPGLPDQIEPQRMLADLQLAFWPLPTLQQALQGSTYEVGEPTPGTRRLKRAGKLAAEVHYADDHPWSGRLWLANYAFGYSLAVDSSPLQ